MRTPADDPRYQAGNGHPRRPYPKSLEPSQLNDNLVRKLHRVLRDSGVLDDLDALFADLPGPDGYPIRLVLLGLACAAYEQGSTNLDDAFETITFGTSERIRAAFSIPICDIHDQDAVNALYNRFHRAWSRMVRRLDPIPHQRRERLPRAQGRAVHAVWNGPAGEEKRLYLDELANRLATFPVQIAFAKGLMRHWHGDIAIDTTAVPAWARRHTSRRSSLEASAGMHYKGGGGAEFGYSATLAIAAHADPDRAGRYPQLILGMLLHTPEKDLGRQAHYISAVLAHLTHMRGYVAADRAYTKQLPQNYHQPMRDLGFRPLLDLTKTQVRPRDDHQGAIATVGRLFCPHTPSQLLDLYQQLRATKNEEERKPIREQLQQLEPFALVRKATADERGAERYSCPAAKVNCPWAREREQRGHKGKKPVPVTIDLDDPRSRSAHPAARPAVHVPNVPFGHRPKCCDQASVTLQPHVMPRMRQDPPWQTPAWALAYSAMRSHIEGGNGRLKGVDTALHAREKRQPRGRVAQTILAALIVMISNIRTIDAFRAAGDKQTRTTFDLTDEDEVPSYPLGLTVPVPAKPSARRASRSP